VSGFRWPASFAGRLLLITLLGLVIRVGYVVVVERGDPLSGDAIGYHHNANLLADGRGFIEPFRYIYGGQEDVVLADGTTRTVITPVGHEEPTAGHPPAWTVILSIASFLGFTSVFAHQLVGAVVGTLTIPMAGILGRELVSERVGLITAGLTAVYAFIWLNDGLVMSETAAILAATAATWAGVRFWRVPTLRHAAVFGLLGGLGALSRAEMVLYLPIVAAVAVLRAALPWRDRVGRFATVGVVSVAVISPWVVYNLGRFAEPVLLSNGTGTVWVQANCDPTYYGPNIGYWELSCGLPQPYGPNGELLDESERDIVVRERAVEYISNHTERLVTVVVPARILRTWALYDPVEQLRLDIYAEERTFALSVVGLIQLYVMAPFAAAGAWSLWRRKLPLLPVALWIPLVTFTVAIAFGNTRYRTVAEVSVVALAAVGVDALWRRLRPERPAVSP
jgi:4-amino-4-deoxy-L-arabinose transferase-like glycosyltransferase